VRGGPARKTGPIMAVPKPINLPSRKAENNGFDPNTQLVSSALGGWSAGGKAAPLAGATPAQSAATGGAAANPIPRLASVIAAAAETGDTILAPKAPWSTGQPTAGAASTPAPAGHAVAGSADFPRLGVTPSQSGAPSLPPRSRTAAQRAPPSRPDPPLAPRGCRPGALVGACSPPIEPPFPPVM
jgi:hypothetical protein